MDQQIRNFFSRYDRANQSSEILAFEELYADRFMFGGPNGTQVVERENFLKVVPRMKAHFASMGVFEREIQTVEELTLDSKYVLAKVGWRMGIRSSSGNTHVDAFATFVLARGPEDALSIVFRIDHQDLASVIKERQDSLPDKSLRGRSGR